MENEEYAVIINPEDLKYGAEDRERGKALSKMLRRNETFAEDSEILLRVMTKKDAGLYLTALREYPYMPDPGCRGREFLQAFLADAFRDERFFCAAYEKRKMRYVGYAGINDLRAPELELAVIILEKYRRKGYGTRIVRLLTERARELTGIEEFFALAETENRASHGFLESAGFVPYGLVPPFEGISDDLLSLLEETDGEEIDEDIERTAEKFGVEPKKLLSHVAKYRLDARRSPDAVQT